MDENNENNEVPKKRRPGRPIKKGVRIFKSFRLSDTTIRQLEKLQEVTGNSQGRIIELAVDKMWRDSARRLTRAMRKKEVEIENDETEEDESKEINS